MNPPKIDERVLSIDAMEPYLDVDGHCVEERVIKIVPDKVLIILFLPNYPKHES